jgi:DNA-binding CsgD family transcriptional regulator
MGDINGLLESLQLDVEKAAARTSAADWGPKYAADVTVLLTLIERARSLIGNPLQDYQLEEREERVALAFISGQPITELAADLGTSRKTVYSILGSALDAMSRHDGREYQREDLNSILARKLTEALGGPSTVPVNGKEGN